MISNQPKSERPKTKVIPINQPESISTSRARVIASDTVSQRVIISIGAQRLAYDFSTRITELPPTTGDQPAPVVPLKRRKRAGNPLRTQVRPKQVNLNKEP